MKRRPTTQDITWLIDLARSNRLDLDPPYQRRSVWTRKDKQFFLDTILRNYPNPAIFLHKSIAEGGAATYHVVDGKQRVQTILEFVSDKLRAPQYFGDARIDGRKWSEIQTDMELMQSFWNYQITVEMIDFADGGIVNEVFDRLNRNSRRLMRQELRHAKYDGWLIGLAEAEAEKKEWQELGISTRARAKRMVDVQFISELLLVLIENKVAGFDQDHLDEVYADFDEVESIENFDQEAFVMRLEYVKSILLRLEADAGLISKHAKSFTHFHSLWSVIGLSDGAIHIEILGQRYDEFMTKVKELGVQQDVPAFLTTVVDPQYSEAYSYLANSRGASTELAQRQIRFNVLKAQLIRD